MMPHDQGRDGEQGRLACILVVERDLATRRLLVNYLEDHGMQAVPASGRQEMIRHLAQADPSLVILGLQLGRVDGIGLLREIRSLSDAAVVVAAGGQRDGFDEVVALELGADDYLIKPLHLRELLARIRAILRRHQARIAAPRRDPAHCRYRFGGWELDGRTRHLIGTAGSPLKLNKSEYALLAAFLDAPQRPLSRAYLLRAIRVHEDILDRSIDVQVLRLRRKLDIDPAAPAIIQTQRGVGYVFTLAVELL